MDQVKGLLKANQKGNGTADEEKSAKGEFQRGEEYISAKLPQERSAPDGKKVSMIGKFDVRGDVRVREIIKGKHLKNYGLFIY